MRTRMLVPMKFTAKELAECAERELARREREYPLLVNKGQMGINPMRMQVEMMRTIAADYRKKAADEPDIWAGTAWGEEDEDL